MSRLVPRPLKRPGGPSRESRCRQAKGGSVDGTNSYYQRYLRGRMPACCDGGRIMSISERVAAHLPYLRRFARAATGSQESGDAYVASTLEAILTDPTILPADLSPRVALYRTFLKIVNSSRWYDQGNAEPPQPKLDAAKRN